MPATAFTFTLSRCIPWFSGKYSRSTSVEEVQAEPRILAPTTLEGASYPFELAASDTGAALSALPQHSPLDLLELSLLCTAQGIAALPVEPQTVVLRTAVAASQVTVVKFVEPIVMEVEILAPTPDISLTPPTPTKRKPKADSRSFTPLQSITSAPGTLRPSDVRHGRKHTSSRRAHDKENVAPAIASPFKTREERLRAYTPPARLLGLRQDLRMTSRYPTFNRF